MVSLGTGRYEPSVELTGCGKVSLKEKVSKIVDSATDTEGKKGRRGGAGACMSICVCVCVRVCPRARMLVCVCEDACVCACVHVLSLIHI